MRPAERAMAVVSMDRMLTNSRPNRRPLAAWLVSAWNRGIHWASILQIGSRWA